MSERKTVNNFKVSPQAIRKKQMAAKRKATRGILVAITAGMVGLGVVGCRNVMESSSLDNTTVTSQDVNDNVYTIDISTDEIPSVALVNDGIDEGQLKEAVSELQNDGVNCQYVDSIESLAENNDYYVISFTNYGGDSSKVIGNYNDGVSIADNFAMAIASEYSNGNIQMGVHDSDSNLVPSDIENYVGNRYIPNVTIAEPNGAKIDTDKLKSGLARMTNLLKKEGDAYSKSAIYRTKPGDSVSSLGDSIVSLNGIGPNDNIKGNVILKAIDYKSFSKDTIVNVEDVYVDSNVLN